MGEGDGVGEGVGLGVGVGDGLGLGVGVGDGLGDGVGTGDAGVQLPPPNAISFLYINCHQSGIVEPPTVQ